MWNIWERRKMHTKGRSKNLKVRGHSEDTDTDKGKGKVVLVLNKAPRHEDILGEWRYSSTHS